jgi:hypothetical protein
MLSRLIAWGAVAVGLLTLVSGCGKGSLHKVNGALTWEDGTPVDGATIVFVPKDSSKKQASGFTGKDGTFDLTTFNSGDGAMEGEYKVVVTRGNTAEVGGGGGASDADHPDPSKAMQEWFKKGGAKQANVKDVIPKAYTAEGTTPLIATIPASGKLELKLKKI